MNFNLVVVVVVVVVSGGGVTGYYDGYPVCFKNHIVKIQMVRNFKSMDNRYLSTWERMEYLRGLTYHNYSTNAARNYRVIEMWECQFKNLCAKDGAIETYIDSLGIHEPMKPRDALHGGRTEVFSKYYTAKKEVGEGLKYYDACSWYPKICKSSILLKGHLRIHIR